MKMPPRLDTRAGPIAAMEHLLAGGVVPFPDCGGRKQVIDVEYVADPWVIAPWAKVDGRKKAGPIERRAQTGEVAAIITPMVGGYLVDICHVDVEPYRVTIHGHADLRPDAKNVQIGEVARRLADAELRHHGFILRSP